MLTLNQVTVVGKVLWEPDRGETATGKKHMVIEVETVEDVYDKQYTQRIKVQVWGYLCDKLEYLRQGDILLVQGRFQERSWEGKDGTKHKVFDVVAREVSFEAMGKSAGTKSAGSSQAQEQVAAPVAKSAAAPARPSIMDDPIPF